MKTVSVSVLKAQLSRYLREVERGNEVQILDRGRPVARLIQADAGGLSSSSAGRQRLIADGILRAGSGKSSQILKAGPLDMQADLGNAVRDEREDRV